MWLTLSRSPSLSLLTKALLKQFNQGIGTVNHVLSPVFWRICIIPCPFTIIARHLKKNMIGWLENLGSSQLVDESIFIEVLLRNKWKKKIITMRKTKQSKENSKMPARQHTHTNAQANTAADEQRVPVNTESRRHMTFNTIKYWCKAEGALCTLADM